MGDNVIRVKLGDAIKRALGQERRRGRLNGRGKITLQDEVWMARRMMMGATAREIAWSGGYTITTVYEHLRFYYRDEYEPWTRTKEIDVKKVNRAVGLIANGWVYRGKCDFGDKI